MANPFDDINPVRKTYFINDSERDSVTPANDAGKVPQLESDGRLGLDFMPSTSPIVRTYLVGDSPATWTKPTGLKYVKVQVQGAGGGSGGCLNGYSGSGGGGAYTEGIITAGDLGATETVTVGAGGAAGAINTGNGGTGESSSFGTHLVAGGGGGSVSEANSGGAGGTVTTAGDFSLNGSAGSAFVSNDDGSTSAGFYMQGPGMGYLSGWVPGVQEKGNDRNYYGPTGRGYGYGGRMTGQDSQPSGITGQEGGPGIVIVTEYYV